MEIDIDDSCVKERASTTSLLSLGAVGIESPDFVMLVDGNANQPNSGASADASNFGRTLQSRAVSVPADILIGRAFVKHLKRMILIMTFRDAFR